MIIEYIKKYGMLRPEDRVLCAVSGGADSMCLLSWLHDNAQTLGIMAFNDLVAADERVEKVILPLRDGLTIIRKK